MNRHIRNIVTGVVTGGTILGTAFASSMLRPVADPLTTDSARTNTLPILEQVAVGDALTPLESGEAYVGAAKISLEPRPGDYNGTWVTDRDACLPQDEILADPLAQMPHIADYEHTPWIENNNCIYMGGYGIGPSNPVTTWDQEYGLWVRSTVVTDANGDTLAFTLLDAEGYFSAYNRLCGPLEPRCGSQQIADDLAAELGLPSSDGIMIGSTHSHTSLDLIGGWGGVPEWYMDQVVDSIKDSIRTAYATRVPATLEAGEVLAREFNGQRRSGYHSAEDATLNYLRGIDRNGAVIATVGTYAAHPVNADEGGGVGHGDFPPIFSAAAEAEFGGVATVMQAGLGNISPRTGMLNQGTGLAARLPDVGDGTRIANPDIRVKRQYWDQPVTNGPLGALGGGGFFDRPFAGPAVVDVGRQTVNRCRSASPVSAHVSVTAAKIGNVVVTAAPGEVFSNFTNTLEERSTVTTLALAQTNDALGYMPQEFEARPESSQGAGFVDDSFFFEYEDAYSIDRCFGDMAMETTLGLLGSL